MSFWGRKPEPNEPPKGKWHRHPCDRPRWEDIDTDDEGTVIGNVWTCNCGRSWQVTNISTVMLDEDGEAFYVQMHWQEVSEVSNSVTDEDIELFKKWTEEASA